MTSSTDDTASGARRRGRRGGGQDTREALLRAAREVFPVEGYDRATVRTIARRAGVDPAMVNHWFGGKENLFTASVAIPINPATIVHEFVTGDPDRIGERMVRRFVTVWDEAEGGSFTALVRSITATEEASRMLREFLTTSLFGRLTRELGVDRPQMRAALCGTQMAGLGLMRYVLHLEPLATADRERVVAAIAPTLQRYLTGDIDGVA